MPGSVRVPGLARASLFLWLGSFFLLLIINSGHYGWSDDRSMLQALRRFVTTGVANVDPDVNAIVGRNGLSFARMEVGTYLLGLPAFLAGLALEKIAPMAGHAAPLLLGWPELFAVLSIATWMALVPVFAACTLLTVNMPWPLAALSGLMILLGSGALEISRYFNSSNGSQLALAGGIYATALAWRARELRLRDQLLFAISLVLLINMRPTSFLLVPGLLFGWAVIVRRNTRAYIWPAVGVLAGVALHAWYNWHRTGSLFIRGYSGSYETSFFHRDLFAGMFAMFFVPRWSILVNVPYSIPGIVTLVILAAYAVRSRRRDARNARLSLLAWVAMLILPQWLIYAKYSVPEVHPMRYHMETMYVLGLVAALLLWRMLARGGRIAITAKAIALPIIVAGAIIHLLSSLMPLPRFEPGYATARAPDHLGGYLGATFRIPIEAAEMYHQFARFPYPDWWMAYLIPTGCFVLLPCMFVAGVLLLLSSMWQRAGYRAAALTCTLITFFGCAIALIYTGSRRDLVYHGTPRSHDTIPGRPAPLMVNVYRLDSQMLADYHLAFPGTNDAGGRFRSFDAIWTPLPGSRDTVHIGGPNIFNSYLYGVDWGKMPAGSTMWFPSVRKANPQMPRHIPGDAQIVCAYDTGQRIEIDLHRSHGD